MNYLDVNGNIPVWAGVVLIGAAGGVTKGVYNGVMAYKADKSVMGVSWNNVAYESMKGFVGGFAGTLAGLWAAASGNPVLSGALAGAVENGFEQEIDYFSEGTIPSTEEALLEVVTSAIFAKLGDFAIKSNPAGRPANMWKGRALSDYLMKPNLRYQTVMGGLVESASILNREQVNNLLRPPSIVDLHMLNLHILTDVYGEQWKKEASQAQQQLNPHSTVTISYTKPPEANK